MSEVAPVLVCDMDETVVRLNSFPSFVRFLGRQLLATGEYRAVCVLISTLVLRKLGLASHKQLKETIHRLAVGVADDSIAGWASRFVESSRREDVLSYVESWPGSRWLSTAAPEVYAVPIGQRLGFDVVQGSTWIAGSYVDNSGAAKVKRLGDAGVDVVHVAISDDPVKDAPLLAMATVPLLVSADQTFVGARYQPADA